MSLVMGTSPLRRSTVCQIPEDPYAVWSSGQYNPVPMLLGANQGEGQTFLYAMSELPSIAFEALADILFGGANTAKIVSYYGDLIPSPWEDGRPFMSQVLTDFWFRCASEQWATSALKQGVPAYFYRYSHVLADSTVFSRFGLPSICANTARTGFAVAFCGTNVSRPRFCADLSRC
jgi:carboxylesterase type B